MPIYLRSAIACVLLAISFAWALEVAGKDVMIGNTYYGGTIRLATIGVDTCGCEESPEPDANEPVAEALARDQLQVMGFPGGLALVSLGYLAWLARMSRRTRAAVPEVERAVDSR